MLRLLRGFVALFRGFRNTLRDEEVQGLLFLVLVLLGVGTVVYHFTEGWSWFDSFYFSVITLTTIGYGDMVPTHFLSRVFTIVYVFSGIGLILVFVNTLATRAGEEEAINRILKRKRKK